jgi:hypothetical protein
MKGDGLLYSDPSTITAALDALAAAGTDSDCDGTSDIQKLKEGRDPSTGNYIDGSGRANPAPNAVCAAGGDAGTGPVIPVYGCGAHIAATPVAWDGAFAVIASLGLFRWRRRARCAHVD